MYKIIVYNSIVCAVYSVFVCLFHHLLSWHTYYGDNNDIIWFIDKKLIGINTQLANKIVLEALNKKKIKKLIKFNSINPETKFSDKTRFDFLISNNKEKCFLEVKNVTLVRKGKIAEFPDAITSRGTKHLKELISAKKKGFGSYILYLIQREDCDSFKIAEDIDDQYKIAFSIALKKGVKILCYDCKLNNEEIKLNKQINYVR